jgi:hypothetical protein
LERVRRVPSRFVNLVHTRTDLQLLVQVRSALQISINPTVLRDLRITEIKWPHVCGTSEIAEANNFAVATTFELETTIFVRTGTNTFSLSAEAIGITIGTITAIIGGMVTDAPSSMDHG